MLFFIIYNFAQIKSYYDFFFNLSELAANAVDEVESFVKALIGAMNKTTSINLVSYNLRKSHSLHVLCTYITCIIYFYTPTWIRYVNRFIGSVWYGYPAFGIIPWSHKSKCHVL